MTKPPAGKPAAKASPQRSAEAEDTHAVPAGPPPVVWPWGESNSPLEAIFGQLDDAFKAASSRVAAMESELAMAKRDLAALAALRQIREGQIPGAAPTPRARKAGGNDGFGIRAVRGEAGQRILALLADIPAGLPAGAILSRLQAETDAEKTSIRNALASMGRNGTLKKVDKNYQKA